MERKDIILQQSSNKELSGHGMGPAKWNEEDVVAFSRGHNKCYDNLESITITPNVPIGDYIYYWGNFPKNCSDPLDGKSSTKYNIRLVNGGKLYLYSDNIIKNDYYFVGVFEYISHELKENKSDTNHRTNSILFKFKKISNDENYFKTKQIEIITKQTLEQKKYIEDINKELENEWIKYKLLLNHECRQKFHHAGVYIYKDDATNTAYVGQATDITKRLLEHFDHLQFLSDTTVFRVFETARLNEVEREWISKMKELGYKLTNKTNGNNPHYY